MQVNIVERIQAANFSATDEQIEALARQQVQAAGEARVADGTYLRILIAAVQAEISGKRRLAQSTVLRTIDALHAQFYAAVLRGVTTPDIEHDPDQDDAERKRRALERNRRGVFARSSKATLVAFVRADGDVRGLVLTEVSKASLRASIAPPETTDPIERRIQRSEAALLRAVHRLAKENVKSASDQLEALLSTLQSELDALTGEPKPRAVSSRPVASRRPGADRPAAERRAH